DLAVAALVARREVEDLEAPHACGAAQRARLPGRQVIAACRLLQVLLQEWRLAEEEVGAGGEPHDRGRIGRRGQRVDHVGDLLAGRHGDQLGAERAERAAIAGRNLDRGVVGGAGAARVLERVEPGAGCAAISVASRVTAYSSVRFQVRPASLPATQSASPAGP